jgi:hypothetical protein
MNPGTAGTARPDFRHLNDPELIAERAAVRERLEHLPVVEAGIWPEIRDAAPTSRHDCSAAGPARAASAPACPPRPAGGGPAGHGETRSRLPQPRPARKDHQIGPDPEADLIALAAVLDAEIAQRGSVLVVSGPLAPAAWRQRS